jgi:hypothetical protein
MSLASCPPALTDGIEQVDHHGLPLEQKRENVCGIPGYMASSSCVEHTPKVRARLIIVFVNVG